MIKKIEVERFTLSSSKLFDPTRKLLRSPGTWMKKSKPLVRPQCHLIYEPKTN